MSKIRVLDQITANSIAAGEVVERPASVVKELVENAMDAGADVITIMIQNGGIRMIRVTDNGSGMEPEDAEIAFLPHATSKLHIITDLDEISTMGFRGEALSSISAVSRVTLKTKTVNNEAGTLVEIEGGKNRRTEPVGTPDGTTIQVEDLFFNTPARYKFLKKDSTEAGRVASIVERMIMARPDISFRLLNHDKQVLHSPGNNDLLSAIYSVYGKRTTGELWPLQMEETNASPIRITGYIGSPASARKNRSQQVFYVNNRVIQSTVLSTALAEGYKTMLMKGQFPFAVIKLEVPANLVDVNVHPQKTEVRFWNEREVFSAIYHTVRHTLLLNQGPREDSAGDRNTGEDVLYPVQTLSSSNFLSDSQSEDVNESVTSEFSHEGSAVWSKQKLNTFVTQTALDIPANDSADTPITSNRLFAAPETQAVEQHTTQTEQGTITEQATVADRLTTVAAASTNQDNPMAPLLAGRIVGHLFNTYIIIEAEDDYYLIDQHAAHEKINYEKLMHGYRNRTVPTHPLLVPVTVDLTVSEMEYAESGRELLERFGFEFEPFGERSMVLRAYPLSLDELSPQEAFYNALERMSELSVSDAEEPNPDDIEHILATVACKASVKAHDKLSDIEIRALLDQMSELDHPFQCPHGRPSVLKMSRYELEKRFKRVVS